MSEVKRFRLSLRDGVVEDTGQPFFPPTHSKPMVLATDYDLLSAECAKLRALLPYTRHYAWCGFHQVEKEKDCTCGLAALRNQGEKWSTKR